MISNPEKAAKKSNIAEIQAFLACKTPQQWLDYAISHQDILLIDHAHCEKKAASSALYLLFRHPDKPDLMQKMSRLAREELRHFEQVHKIMNSRGVQYCHLESSGYAQGLKQHVRTHEPARLVDTLIIGAIIEARSCERFYALAPLLDDELNKFYSGLLASESRHYRDYLKLAQTYSKDDISSRINVFREAESSLILNPDPNFRFHSGLPI